MTIAAFTGHRPQKLGGYNINHPRRVRVRELLRAVAATEDIEAAITGGALGVDQDAALEFRDAGKPYIVAAPCRGQDNRWPAVSQQLYHDICIASNRDLLIEIMDKSGHHLPHEDGVVFIHDGPYNGPKCMQDRNIWMVDYCDILIALWDGSSGGTKNCVDYAKAIGKPVANLWHLL